jgi:hypothetical protein
MHATQAEPAVVEVVVLIVPPVPAVVNVPSL